MKVNFLTTGRSTLGAVMAHMLLAGMGLFIVCVLYFAVYLPGTTNHNKTVVVPEFEGKQFQELEPIFLRANLQYQVNDSAYSSDYPALAVLKQYPPAGSKVKEGRKIFLSINQRTPPTVVVPDLVDGSVINADAVLKSSQLKLGKIEYVPGPYKIVKEMQYQGQGINASSLVPKGSFIDLVVMDGLGEEETDTIH